MEKKATLDGEQLQLGRNQEGDRGLSPETKESVEVRYCSKCQKKLIPSKNWYPAFIGKRNYVCKDCAKGRAKAYYWKHRKERHLYVESHKNERLDWRLQKRYGISLAEWNAILIRQDGNCVLCKKPLGKSGNAHDSPVLDHNHKTGKVRGIIHRLCNTGLGAFQESTECLKRARDYLLEYD